MLDCARLGPLAVDMSAGYSGAQPFPHAVIDDFLPPQTLARVIDEFPRPEDTVSWLCFDATTADGRIAQHRKRHVSDERRFGATTRQLFHELRGAVFVEWLESLTGIAALIPDPHNIGGGLHACLPGALLRIHADFGLHPLWKLDRRLNLLLYLNDRWDPRYGGELELWAPDMARCVRRIAPIANRCVVFSTTRRSYHGHPDPLTCPDGRSRNAIALYYYTNGGTDETGFPDPLWQVRPGEAPDA